jgi:hypothetical protein
MLGKNVTNILVIKKVESGIFCNLALIPSVCSLVLPCTRLVGKGNFDVSFENKLSQNLQPL